MRIHHKSNKHGLVIKKEGRTVYLYRSKDLVYCIQSGDLDSEGSMEHLKYTYNEIVRERNHLNKPPVINDGTVLESEYHKDLIFNSKKVEA